MKAKDAVIWVNYNLKKVLVTDRSRRPSRLAGWCDPLGAAYTSWHKATNARRMLEMQELAIELGARGFDMNEVLRELAQVREFWETGRESYFMCRALTTAILGKPYEPVTLTYDELFEEYGGRQTQPWSS